MPYEMPTPITFGEGCVGELARFLDSAQRIAFFHGKKSYRANESIFKKVLQGKQVEHFDDFAPEPEVATLESMAMQIQALNPGLLLAVGGGSALDLAKGVAFCANQKAAVLDLLNGEASATAPSLPVIAVPTTAGTGSEVTPFAVFWDHDAKQKYSLAYKELYPAQAIVDPELTYSMPPDVTANTGMDAFTQACEAYWNNNHNPTSDALALEAISLMLPALPRAVADGTDKKARHDMMLGSLRTGQAFSNTRTAACHSISYPMTLYFGVPHGQAVGITLPAILPLNAEAMPERARAFYEAMSVTSIENAAAVIRFMMDRSGLQTRLSGLNIKREDIDIIVRHAFAPKRMSNNPYQFTAESLRTMLHSIL
ncbi:MAG TPA: iron-containing alcohol dehydrogenase [Candidatus Peribacteraceae bacterium]|nr:iron-containing alcohol dehydrogenase [Candidatus Peribacteraceae bacterium]